MAPIPKATKLKAPNVRFKLFSESEALASNCDKGFLTQKLDIKVKLLVENFFRLKDRGVFKLGILDSDKCKRLEILSNNTPTLARII
ncbi:MAG: hypothetical protein OHK0019_08590 [Saprospiraceae bacterium]